MFFIINMLNNTQSSDTEYKTNNPHGIPSN